MEPASEQMSYREAVEFISSLQSKGWRLGLDRMQEFARRIGVSDALGAPGGPQFIHVAGTNGKGSVTAFLQHMLMAGDWRTGAFFSPYVYNLRERIQFADNLIPEEALVKLTSQLKPLALAMEATELGGPTEFEFKLGLGLLYWKLLECQWVALEVGLGGRLDATNIVSPRCSVIVSIGLDHTQILGSTYARIAREKAGIIKPGVPVVVGELPPEAMDVVQGVAGELESPLLRFGHEFILQSANGAHRVSTARGVYDELRCPLIGLYMPHNMAVAIAALEASGAIRPDTGVSDVAAGVSDVAAGVAATKIPG
ncbi:MAG TPA: hypothetical protein VM328_09940, partial [Fimbriimonadaceae bacterium]|nr:hypothetical protein [Fimbriimonadaceae bacterium]